MDGNVELFMTCIIGTFETPYTITSHIKQEKTTSVTGGTLIFFTLCDKYPQACVARNYTLPPFFSSLYCHHFSSVVCRLSSVRQHFTF